MSFSALLGAMQRAGGSLHSAIARELGDDARTGAGLFCASSAGIRKGDAVLQVPLRCVLSRERASRELRRLAGGEEERAEGEVDALLLYLVVARLAMQRREDG
jgi:hypothetical protein